VEDYKAKFACAISISVCLVVSEILNKHGHAIIEYEIFPYIFIEKAPRKFTDMKQTYEILCFHQIFSNILWNCKRRKRKFQMIVTETDSH